VDRVLIDDNQHVKKGDLLVTIDPRDYDAALRQKQASLDSFKAQAAAVEATIEQQQAHLNTLQSTQESDQATAEADRANALNAAILLKRNQELFARQVIAPQDLDRTTADADATKATLDEFKVRHPIVNLRVLGDRNLLIATLLMFLMGAILYSTTAVLPRFLQTLLNYPALQSGLVLSPRGIGSIIGAVLAGQILSRTKIDGRYWMAQGALVLAFSMVMFGSLNLDIAPGNVIWPIIISGFGIPSIFVPMTTFSVATVGKAEMADATGITSLVRNLGGSVSISLITTFVTRGTQAHQALMVGHLVPHNHVYLDRLSQMGTIVAPHSGAVMAQSQGYGLMYGTLQQQAALWSYIDQFRLLAIVSLLLAPIIFLYRKSPSPSK
jgi:hypothetical protein